MIWAGICLAFGVAIFCWIILPLTYGVSMIVAGSIANSRKIN